MHILDQISLALKPDIIAKAIFQGEQPDEGWEEKIRRAICIVQPLVRPGATYQWYQIENLDNNSVVLKDSFGSRGKLNIGPNVSMLQQARSVLCCCATIGKKLDNRLDGLSRKKKLLEVYLEDCVGTYCLLLVSRAVYKEVEQFADQYNWGVGSVMSPGAIQGWALEDQKVLCSLLNIGRINVQLNDGDVLIPKKSVTFIVGIGPDYSSKKVDIPCHICTSEGGCWCTF